MPAPDLNQTLSKDRHFLQRAFRQPEKYSGIASVERKYQKSHAAFLKRQAALPKPDFDHTLPVHERLNDIKTAVANHQVTIICGETGSGKTTQLPKICLELGRGAAGLIGHTQPRRLAARSVAERIAEELGQPIGQAVGYKVRFNDHTSREANVKLMTDGILLAETQTDRYLAAYDTLIIDEAHERSLNIDFLLGYLKQLLPRRPDLKVIITSATIDAERFSRHFNNAPVLEVSGRTYPVEIRYRPINERDEDEAEIDLPEAIADAADELARLGDGDILVFLPGEREIREAAEALRKSPLRRNDEILPLFARLSAQEQHKIFHPNGSKRRIVLATNVAETSLTVPGIKYVIDTGLARVKRYSARAKVEQLHVEKISQAAARQRAGRCGRVSAGVCIRLYAEDDFNQRPPFTDPEIVRSNLAAVILRMAALKLGDVAAFPFLEAPDQRYINDGFQVLLELGAVNDQNALTRLGEQMARLPIDPKVARILIAARKHDCMAEILVIVSALSIQDPRERPLEAREAAAKAHERFADKQSDFLAYLNIWDSFQREHDKGLSNRQMVAWCHQYFLSHLRMREWRELHAQLAQIAIEMGLTDKESAFRKPEAAAPQVSGSLKTQTPSEKQSADLAARLKQKELDKKHARAERRAAKEAGYEQIHRALLTGLIANVGMKSPDGNDYTGARGSRFHLFPASALFKSKPKWVMAAELTETTRLYARDVAAIQPEWIEQEAPHLVRYHHFEPHWEQKRGEVVASERVTLYGLTVLPRRPVAYGRIAPEEAREIFIRSALVAQEVADFNAPFFVHNQKLIREIAELEHKSRRQDVLVDEEALFAFYDARLPKAVFKERGEIVGQAENGQRSSETPFRAERLAPKGFAARQMTAADLDALYGLCQSQPDYYRHLGEPLTRDKLARSLTALPPDARRENKHFIGFWQQGSLKAALEIIFAYPDKETVLLGLLMVDKSAQGAGIGSNIAQNLATVAAESGYHEIILSYAEGNAQSRAFWLKNGYQETGESDEPEQDGEARLIAMSRRLPEAQTPSEKPLADIRTFAAWLKTAERDNPRLLFLTRDDLMQHAAAHITEEQFPKFWRSGDGKFKLAYRFEPHHPLDGVTMSLPLTVLNRIAPVELEWLVPGMLREKIQLLIKALPKQIRRICVPVPEFVTRFLESSPDRSQSIIPQLARFIAKTAGDIRILDQINPDDWASFRLPEHCYFNLRIIDDGGQELAMGRDLIQLQQELGQAAAVTFRDNTQEFERDNLTAWDIGTLPEHIKFARAKQQLTGYLGLQQQKDHSIALRLFDTPHAAATAHRQGVIALMKLQLKEQVKDLNKGIQGFTQAAMLLRHIPADTLRDDLTAAVCDRAFIGDDEPPRNEKAFKEQIKRARSRLPAVKEAVSRYLGDTAAAYAELNGKLGKHPLTPLIRKRLDTLLGAGFASRTPWAQWHRLPVYIRAMTLRLDKYSSNPARDAARDAEIQELENMWAEKVQSLEKQSLTVSDGLAAFRWMTEELRVSLFAQELKTPYPVSVKRLLKEWGGLDKG